MASKLMMAAVGGYLVLLLWDIDPSGWLASAGVLGIVVGLGARDTLANLFGGFSIIADAPYRVGDMVRLDTGERGRVTRVGLRSTRLLTRDDTEITIPNAVIAGVKVINESGGPYRKTRIRVPVGVAYDSDPQLVIRLLEESATGHSEVVGNPEPRVRMRAFGDNSLDFELLCWIDDPVPASLVKPYRSSRACGSGV
ncbi:MAG: mechanosensitive ion channel family protein, partial [bacterium]|nr:mechanosensitive ion channel family protein [bacterium]